MARTWHLFGGEPALSAGGISPLTAVRFTHEMGQIRPKSDESETFSYQIEHVPKYDVKKSWICPPWEQSGSSLGHGLPPCDVSPSWLGPLGD